MEILSKPDSHGCVSASKAETPVLITGLSLSTTSGVPSEQQCLAVLVKVYGWRWLEAGVLSRPWSQAEVA